MSSKPWILDYNISGDGIFHVIGIDIYSILDGVPARSEYLFSL